MQPNEVKIITCTNGILDIAPPAGPYGTAFDWPRVLDAYSGGVFNPYWGARGCVVFHGGGHADSNHNAVAILDYNDMTFKLVHTSTGSAGLQGTGGYPDPGTIDREFGEVLPTRDPAAAHTYDHPTIVPPWVYDAEYGTLLRPVSAAWHTRLSGVTTWAHKLRLVERAALSPLNRWTRASVNGWSILTDPGSGGQPLNNDAGADIAFRTPQGGGCADFDSLRTRVWWRSGEGNQGAAYYLDCRTSRQVRVPFTSGFEFPAYVDSYTMRYIAHRDWLVLIGVLSSGVVVGATMDPNNPAGAYTAINFTSTVIPTRGFGHAIAWDYCPETGTIFAYSPADLYATYEIAIPTLRTGNWTVTRRQFATGPSIANSMMTGAYVSGKRWHWHPPSMAFLYKPGAVAPFTGEATLPQNQIYAYRPPGLAQ